MSKNLAVCSYISLMSDLFTKVRMDSICRRHGDHVRLTAVSILRFALNIINFFSKKLNKETPEVCAERVENNTFVLIKNRKNLI